MAKRINKSVTVVEATNDPTATVRARNITNRFLFMTSDFEDTSLSNESKHLLREARVLLIRLQKQIEHE